MNVLDNYICCEIPLYSHDIPIISSLYTLNINMLISDKSPITPYYKSLYSNDIQIRYTQNPKVIYPIKIIITIHTSP